MEKTMEALHALIAQDQTQIMIDDMAAASVFVVNLDRHEYESQTEPMQSQVNVSFGFDITITELVDTIGSAVGYQGKIKFDSSKPDRANQN
jgi:GDP-L-fucose synthase